MLKHLKIGSIVLKNNLILAPMAGYADIAFRRLCREYGAGLTPTEMVSSKGLVYKNKGSYPLLQASEIETPSCVQFFGSSPGFFVRAINELNELNYSFDIIDVNMGCPMPKITKNGDGSALMRNTRLASEIVETLKKHCKVVTCKIRIGWDENNINAIPFARALESAGADAVTVHGRTRAQLYSGKANWDIIGDVKAKLIIPVIGNGDVKSTDEAQEKFKKYKVDGIMIGRGAIGNPGIFRGYHGNEGIDNLAADTPITAIILKHIGYLEEYFDERYIINSMKKHLAYYLKGIDGTRELRQRINTVNSVGQLKDLVLIAF